MGRRVNLMNVLDRPTWRTLRPARVLGVTQKGGPEQPAVCTKCGALWFRVDYWECQCLCGERWVRTVGEIPPPRSAHVTAALARYRTKEANGHG